MKLYTIEVCACGTVWERDVNCPPSWVGSGCYDVDHEVYREFRFYVSAMSQERALKLVSKWWFNNEPDWCSLDAVFYDPSTVEEQDDPECGEYEEVYDYESETAEPVYSSDIPTGYSEELPTLTLQEKLDDALRRFESKARINVRSYKDRNDRVVSHYEGWLDLIVALRWELRK